MGALAEGARKLHTTTIGMTRAGENSVWNMGTVNTQWEIREGINT